MAAGSADGARRNGGALNTMMSSVSDRTVEIATVRALGFSRLSAFIATWVEAVALAAMGVTIGLIASWLVFNGWQASTIGANNTSLSFRLTMDGHVMLTAGLLGWQSVLSAALCLHFRLRDCPWRLPYAIAGNYLGRPQSSRSIFATANDRFWTDVVIYAD